MLPLLILLSSYLYAISVGGLSFGTIVFAVNAVSPISSVYAKAYTSFGGALDCSLDCALDCALCVAEAPPQDNKLSL